MLFACYIEQLLLQLEFIINGSCYNFIIAVLLPGLLDQFVDLVEHRLGDFLKDAFPQFSHKLVLGNRLGRRLEAGRVIFIALFIDI